MGETARQTGHSLQTHIAWLIDRVHTEMGASCPNAAVTAIGLAFPGVVTMPRGACGEVRWLPNLEPHWNVSSPQQREGHYAAVNGISRLLAEKYGCAVRVLNDAKAFGVAEAVLGECRGVPRGRATVIVLGTGVGDVTIEEGAVDFARAHQASQAVIDTGTHSYEDGTSGAPGSLSGYLSQTRWEGLVRTIGVPNIDAALFAGDAGLHDSAMALISQQAQHLIRWIIHRRRREDFSMVILSGGRIAGRAGTCLVSETQRLLQQSGTPVGVVLSGVDPLYGGAIGAALFASSFPVRASAAKAA